MSLPFPQIDPIAIAIGPLVIRWYALAYIAGILGGLYYARYLCRRFQPRFTNAILDDAIFWATLGIIFGGRIGYCLFYKPDYYLLQPWEIFYLWHGGMSFHGGFLGVLLAMILFARSRRLPFWPLIDVAACVTPIGLGLGRIANFINGELYGRVTDGWWGMIFPNGGPLPRHPSQLYQAALEGLVMLAVLAYLAHRTRMLQKPAMASGVFLLLYGGFRCLVEFVREPDDFLGLLAMGLSMGQWLSLPMILAGLFLIYRAQQNHASLSR
jgi:phosphatidylglycerol:prolipoprotein diacylglycerol transferase